MRNDLMAEKIEVHPFIARPPFGTAEQFAVKGARLGKIAHGKSQMKAWTFGHIRSFWQTLWFAEA